MIILLRPGCDTAQRAEVLDLIEGHGCRATGSLTPHGELLVIEGDLDQLREMPLTLYPAIRKVVPVSKPYTLGSLEHQSQPTVVPVGDVRIGGGSFTIIGGPCAIENEERHVTQISDGYFV